MIKNIFRKFKVGLLVLIKPLKIIKRDRNFKYSIIYNFYRENFKVKDKVVLLETAHGEKIGGNPYALFLEMEKSTAFSGFKYIFVLNNEDPFYKKYLSQKKNIKIVQRNSCAYIKYLAISKYLINDTTFHFYFSKREEQIYINTWHGTPIKTIGRDVKGTLGQQKNAVRNFLHADYLVHPNEFTSEIINSSHELLEIYDGKNIVTGYPRIDLTLKADKKVVRSFLEETLGRKIEEKIILYAPTWRGELGKSQNLNEELLSYVEQIQKNIPPGYTLLLKVHNLSYKFIEKEEKFKGTCIPNWFETNELLSIVDVLITDYSSIFFDFLHTKRPVLLFAYDFERYQEERGMYLDIKHINGRIFENIEDLVQQIKDISLLDMSENKYYLNSIYEYCSLDDGNSAQRVLNEIDNNSIDKVNAKKKMVIYGGSMNTNGVTVSLMNLLNNLDYSKYDVTLLHGGVINNDNSTNLHKLPRNVKLVYRMGGFNFGLGEYYLNYLLMNHGFKWGFLSKYFPAKLYKKEFERLVGNAKYDIVIDYCGYSPMWTAILASSDISKKILYLHSEMKTDVEKRSEKDYKVAVNFNIIFNLYNKFDKIISVSKDVHDLNKENFKTYAAEEKFSCIPNPIDFNKVLELSNQVKVINFDSEEFLVLNSKDNVNKKELELIQVPSEEKINFITIGRLTNEKDQQKIINAFKILTENHDNLHLYIVGDGYLKNSLTSLTKQLNLENEVTFTGALNNPFALLKLCDCFVLSSNYEGQGLVVLESLILNKSVISTDIVGPRGILKDGHGKLVENSVEGLVEGMELFIQGKLENPLFDYKQYNKEAMTSFYKEID